MEGQHMYIYYRPEWTCGRYNAEHGVMIEDDYVRVTIDTELMDKA